MVDNELAFDNSFQNKVTISLITDFTFLQTIYDILDPEYFESDGRKWIVSKAKEYYKKYKNIPSFDVLKTEYDKEENELLKINIKQKLKDAYDLKEASDLAYIKDNFRQFCIHQNFKKAVLDSVDYLKAGKFDRIKKAFDDALKAGQPNNLGKDLLVEAVERIFEEEARSVIKTPWDVITDLADGGFGKKELYIGVGGPGSGKSFTLCSIGNTILLQGKTVFHYTLELSETMTAKRYYTIMTGIQGRDLKESVEEIKERIDKTYLPSNGKLIIKEYPTKRATVDTISAHIDSAINNGIKPDAIIIDYGDLLRSTVPSGDRRLDVGNIFEELRGLAVQYEVPVITVTQANRSSADAEFVSGENVSEDYSKIMIGDFIFSISRNMKDAATKTAKIYIIKNRFGPDKMLLPAKFDLDSGKLEIFEPTSAEGVSITSKNKSDDDYIKQRLKTKYFGK